MNRTGSTTGAARHGHNARRVAMACGLALCACAFWARADATAGKPNIVLILADDLGWRDVGFAGAKLYESPSIDQLAGEGMVFNYAYSGGPNCSPTRACLMSGTYTPRHHIYTPGGKSKGNPQYMRLLVPANGRKDKVLKARAANQFRIENDLSPEFTCIAEVLKTAGYVTARLGKWHLGDDTQGFDLSSGNGKDGPGGHHYGNVDVAESLTDRALQFIEENKQRPFFLYFAHWDVHTPYRATDEQRSKWDQKRGTLPKSEQKEMDPVYAAMIERVDVSVGRVVEKIDTLGLAEQTLIIFSSDNGGRSVVSEMAPLRGEKGSLFEGGIRVPTCMRWPGVIGKGRSCDTPITSVDFLPTFADLAGAQLPAGQPADGVSIVPLLKGQSIAERSIFWHYPLYLAGRGLNIEVGERKQKASWRGFPSTALRRGKWKAIEFLETRTMALYDIESDPGETTDVSADNPDIAQQLHDDIHAWQTSRQAPIPSEPNPECTLAPIR